MQIGFRKRSGAGLAGAALTALLLATTSCSSVPDSLNPGKMADSVGRVFDSGPPTEGEEQPSPNLATVPGRVRPSPAQNRQRIANELASDRANARYSDDPVGQRTPEAAPPAPVAAPALSTPPVAPQPADAPKPPGQPAVELDEAGQPKINTGYYATSAPPKPAREAPAAPAPAADTVPDAPPAPPVLTEPYKRGGPVPVRPTQADGSTPVPPPSTVGVQPPVPGGGTPGATAPGTPSYPPAAYTPPPAYTPPSYAPPAAAAPAYAPAAPLPAPAVPAMPVLGQVAVIYFADGATNPTASDLAVLREVADLYRRQGGRLRVVGHSSQRSSTMDPVKRQLGYLDESSKRADAVARALAKLGVPGSQIGVEAAGASQPLYDEGTTAGEAGNRRVEIFLDN